MGELPAAREQTVFTAAADALESTRIRPFPLRPSADDAIQTPLPIVLEALDESVAVQAVRALHSVRTTVARSLALLEAFKPPRLRCKRLRLVHDNWCLPLVEHALHVPVGIGTSVLGARVQVDASPHLCGV